MIFLFLVILSPILTVFSSFETVQLLISFHKLGPEILLKNFILAVLFLYSCALFKAWFSQPLQQLLLYKTLCILVLWKIWVLYGTLFIYILIYIFIRVFWVSCCVIGLVFSSILKMCSAFILKGIEGEGTLTDWLRITSQKTFNLSTCVCKGSFYSSWYSVKFTCWLCKTSSTLYDQWQPR